MKADGVGDGWQNESITDENQSEWASFELKWIIIKIKQYQYDIFDVHKVVDERRRNSVQKA